MTGKRPSPYDVLVQAIDDLPTLVKHTRDRKGLSLREAAKESSVPLNVLSRTERGLAPSVDNLKKLLLWMRS